MFGYSTLEKVKIKALSQKDMKLVHSSFFSNFSQFSDGLWKKRQINCVCGLKLYQYLDNNLFPLYLMDHVPPECSVTSVSTKLCWETKKTYLAWLTPAYPPSTSTA